MNKSPLKFVLLLVLGLCLIQHSLGRTQDEWEEELISSMMDGDSDRMHEALEHGASIDSVDHGGRTALHLAISTRRRDMVAYLLNAGADPSAVSNTGHSSLIYAAIGKMSDVAQMLLELDVDIEAKIAPWTKTSAGSTALHVAVMHGDLRMVGLLMGAGADPHSLNEAEESCVDLALKSDHSMRLLTALGEDPKKYLSEETIYTQRATASEL